MTDTTTMDALHQDYVDPVARLLTEGDANLFESTPWPDYPGKFALGLEHVAELIRMSCDMTLHDDDSDSDAMWAPVHAWRALGQLRAEEAIEPLTQLMLVSMDDDAAAEELPKVLAMIGPSSIPAIVPLLGGHSRDWVAASAAARALAEIALRFPARRSDCLGFIVKALSRPAEADPTRNGLLLNSLLDMKAVEAIDTIREAFRLDAVDITIAGDLEDVEIDLGLRRDRTTPKPRYSLEKIGKVLDLHHPVARNREIAEWPADIEPVRTSPKVGRNESCPCGSGKKYKKCCMA